MSISKRLKSLIEKVDRDKLYPVLDGLNLVKETAKAKFDESVDAAINLGIDAKKSDQAVRGALVLPNGTGKTTRVAVFAQGEAAEAARATIRTNDAALQVSMDAASDAAALKALLPATE